MEDTTGVSYWPTDYKDIHTGKKSLKIAKDVIRNGKSKQARQYHGQWKRQKRANNGPQNTAGKLKIDQDESQNKSGVNSVAVVGLAEA